MKHRLKYSVLTYTFAFLLLAGTTMPAFAASKAVPLITDYNNIHVNNMELFQNDYGVFAQYLIDGNPGTYYHSNYSHGKPNSDAAHMPGVNALPYIDVKLSEPLKASDNLYIYTQARRDTHNGHPTEFHVYESQDGVSWTSVKKVSIAFSGQDKNPGEENYSERFNVQETSKWLRFECTKTFSNDLNPNEDLNPAGKIYMVLAEFQVYKSEVDLSTLKDNPAAMLTDDKFHSIFDYIDTYEDFEFVHTRGIVSNLNHNTNGLKNWCDWNNWTEGKWTADADFLKEQNIKMPDFSFINKETAPWGRVVEGDRQRTHVTEHTVYAIPGQVTTMYPYSDTHSASQYEQNYTRWYDYTNDKPHKYLDFIHNPSKIVRTKHGYFGSSVMPTPSAEYYDVYIRNVDDYKRFIDRVAAGETRLSAKQCADLDFSGRSDINPIGWTTENPFRGIYDGNGYAITNLVIDKPGWTAVGMFGHVGAAIIRNLNIHSSCTFSGGNAVGLVGCLDAKEYDEKEASGTLLIHNVSTAATVRASGKNAGGLVGANYKHSSQAQIVILNCAVLGSVSGPLENAAVCGWGGDNIIISNTYSVADVSGIEVNKGFCRGTVFLHGNNYDKNNGNGLPNLPYQPNDGNLIASMGSSNWMMGGWNYVLPNVKTTPTYGEWKTGTFATFYCPEGETFSTQYIAVDFSQSFNRQKHIDFENKKIYEPSLVFRHIFRVVNATDLADQVSGSIEKNEKYVSENRRTIRARAGHDFQVRFEHPQPVEQATRTTMFYLNEKGETRRVRKSKIKVTDRQGNDRTGIFYPIANYRRPDARNLQGAQLPDIYDLEKEYSRMMKCDAANANGRFTVHLVGCDENGNELKIYGTTEPLILAEYIINFVDEKGAAMTSEAEMHTEKYAHTRPATLRELYGEPIAVVNFDEYRLLANLPDKNNYLLEGPAIPGSSLKAHKYKWPVPWDNSQYGYGFDVPHDYSMYMLADHSEITPYHSSTSLVPASENFGIGQGRFDRLFHDTEGKERGFFYYANAASDPGVTAKLDISDLCPGSTLFVSAWICEFSQNIEVENIIFNFNVVKKDGTEFTLHSFVTGYVPEVAQWQHVFYQFTPNLSQLNMSAEEIDSYKLVLENNCLSSAGADYAIDDIRVYAAKPRVYAQQTTPLCRGEHGTDVQIQTPFEVMLATLGVNEASTGNEGNLVDCFYTFVDKAKYEKELSVSNDGLKAYNEAVVKYEYMPGQGADQTFGHLTFNTHYQSNREYSDGNSDVKDFAWRKIIEGERYLIINTNPRDEDLKVGKDYIVALYVDERESDQITPPDPSMFALGSECAKSSTFRIHASGVIKIDGVVVPDLDNITVCENQTPVVQINIQSKDSQTGAFTDRLENAITDWWDGSMEDYLDQQDGENGPSLYKVMSDFRKEYPEADTWDVPAKGDYTEAMREYLRTLCEPDPETGTPARLLLYRSSFVFHPVKMAPGADKTHVYAVAIPIDIYGDDVTVCTTPSEIRLTVRNDSPWLRHGLSLDYPTWMDDVPLRIGLRQLESVSAEDIQHSISSQTKLLSIPVRAVSVVTESVNALERIPDDNAVYLVETNDPEYIDLNIETVDGQASGLHAMGALSEIVAQKGDNKSGNVLKMAFDSDFKFKEGHYYRLRFSFQENGVPSSPTGDDGEGAPRHCHGQQVFTLKVVPEYQAWVALPDSTNWNNDKNWRRVTKEDLLAADASADDLDRFVTDGSDSDRSTADSYVPMDFTKVIIPAGVSLPRLYAPAQTQQVTVDGQSYSWPANITAPAGNSNPSDYIIYDMAAKGLAAGIGCRPWYTNTCDQIHFHSNAEILGQNLLSHNRAWVDFEIEPELWYTLASPLTGVVAGDMYLPTDGARQLTQLFTPITFNTGLNDRFAPAVYQRSWNKASATVYELGGSTAGTNVAIRTTWSHVYNDVEESYSSPATGFSIKADVSKAKVPEDLERVLFRLPKDDSKYLYYDNNSSATGHETQIDRTAGNKLHQSADGNITSTVSAAAPSKYFLVGNPFMAHLDVAAFLTDNSALINPKYWVMNSEGQAVAVYNNGSFDATASTMADPGLVPPLQGFFVEAKEARKELSLTFNSAHTTLRPFDPETDGNRLRSPRLHNPDSPASRSAASAMRITAMRDEHPLSQALVLIDPNASQAYDEAEDAATLFDSLHGNKTTVYTIAGNMAAAVNALPGLTTTEIGLDAETGQRTVLHFADTDCLPGALLFDALTGEEMPLYNGMQYEIEGPATARLFIVPDTADHLGNEAIRVQTSGNRLTVTAPDNGLGLSVAIHDMAGRTIHSSATDGNTTSLTLQTGIYLLQATTPGVEPLRTKILIQK